MNEAKRNKKEDQKVEKAMHAMIDDMLNKMVEYSKSIRKDTSQSKKIVIFHYLFFDCLGG